MGRERNILIEKYLEEHSLVESNVLSFNDFVSRRMQQIVDEINDGLDNEDIEIKLGKVRVGKPNIIEADGSSSVLTPMIARLRNLTYSAPVYVEISVKYGEQTDSSEVEIGRIPIIVKSASCSTHGMSKEELEENYEDSLNPGGYFIINGNERVIVMSEDLAPNQPFVDDGRQGLILRMFSQRGSYRIPTTISETSEGILDLTFSRLKNVPLVVILKALGMVKEADIAKAIDFESDCLIVNFYEYGELQSADDAMVYIAEKSGIQGTKKEVIDRVKQRVDSFLLPHIGLDKNARKEKARTLCRLLNLYLRAKEDSKIRTDKDHYANKRVKLSGDLMADLFRVNMNILIRDIQYSLQKISKRKKFYSLKTVAKSTLFTHRIESAIATGSWIGERSGVTQNMNKTNYLRILSQLQKVTSMLPGDQENFLARTLHPTHYGRFCPIETPEGVEIGLRKNLALLAKISTAVNFEEADVIKKFKDSGLHEDVDEKTEGKKVDVFFNGRAMGFVEDGTEFAKKVRGMRRKRELPNELNVRSDEELGQVTMSTEVGRILRPMIIVENGASKLKDEDLVLLGEGKKKWADLIQEEKIEYLDTAEEENALVALEEENISEGHTHLEIHPIDAFGLITSLVPFANHDPASRLLKGSKTLTQSLGIYAANYLLRIDTNVSILHYPQKPIVRSFIYDTLDVYPSGQNIVVAILPYEGYNLEDAVVLNKASVDRGVGRSTYFRPYGTTELQYAGGLSDEITIPDKDVSGYRMEESYRFLEDDGIAFPEADMSSGEVIIGKLTPPKFLSEARDISVQAKKEASSAIRQEEKGTVDAVFITVDGEGNKVVQVRTRDQRVPEPGDKLSAPHGQKGVIGLIADEKDIPFTSKGIKPDLIFNPHGLPSRMSVGYMMELLGGKTAATSGKIVDGTSFTGQTAKEFENQLESHGFRYDGKETMYNGVTGKKMDAKIYIGNMYYLKLERMVKNLLHARASGKVALLTRQPIEGRARGGGLRLGEMEQQALVGHGASLLLKERYNSDKTKIYICKECGNVTYEDIIRNKTPCMICGGNESEPIEVSYAFKLLVDELLGLGIHTKFELKNKFER
ncbi:DNA-directed RNA polymerase subunit B [Candidatus Pacearchaeota archaeon]|nr:DNA-directed RNA polymerase subunit B [Candidatus Pacearchaeota archaeon]|tara:strand:- start:7122 stop:10391 length:3270 start_codon:yes stop_codon:yes gene_type:complete